MATRAPITGAPTCAPAFKLNGCEEGFDEPYPYLDQAHGVLNVLVAAIEDPGENGALNPLILAAASRGAAVLVYLAALGLKRMDENGSAGS